MNTLMLFLTCLHQEEAEIIATALLQKRLVACIKMVPVRSMFLWKGAIERGDEVLLIMDTAERMFPEVEEAVRELHSYSTFVLTACEITEASSGVAKWIQASVGNLKL